MLQSLKFHEFRGIFVIRWTVPRGHKKLKILSVPEKRKLVFFEYHLPCPVVRERERERVATERVKQWLPP